MASNNPKQTALYGFAFTEAALSYLESLPTKKIRRQVKSKIEQLAADPTPPTCKKLSDVTDGGNPVYRVRSGDYRILYVVRNPIIVVLDIGDRKDIYK